MRFRNTSNGRIQFTEEEEIARDLEEAAIAENVMSEDLKIWTDLMKNSDTTEISRNLEDHIEFDHGGVSSNPDLQAKYDSKKDKRSQRPEEV